MSKYDTATITNIRQGKGARAHIIYAHLESADGDLLISATLDYICKALKERRDILLPDKQPA